MQGEYPRRDQLGKGSLPTAGVQTSENSAHDNREVYWFAQARAGLQCLGKQEAAALQRASQQSTAWACTSIGGLKRGCSVETLGVAGICMGEQALAECLWGIVASRDPSGCGFLFNTSQAWEKVTSR